MSPGVHPWAEDISETALNRFSKDKSPTRLTLVDPIVAEVSGDVAWSGQPFPHPRRYLRARPELQPPDVGIPEDLPR